MNLLRAIVLIAFTGPMLASTVDACCSVAKGVHETTGFATTGMEQQLQAVDVCCDADPCADCTMCHTSSFSPLHPHLKTQNINVTRITAKSLLVFTEVVAAVLTPPPTF